MRSPSYYKQKIDALAQIPVYADDIKILLSAKDFRLTLLDSIKAATKRIYLPTLYLQDDEAGKEIMGALYAAKQRNPRLDIKLFVDFHRAQRTLIGQKGKGGNTLLYQEMKNQYSVQIDVYGIPVKTREIFGVLHLKGFVFDHELLYSGASLNDVYLHQKDQYRYDRYFMIKNKFLADTMIDFLNQYFVNNSAPQPLDRQHLLSARELKLTIRRFRKELRKASYQFDGSSLQDEQVGITPISGFGRQKNQLNLTIHHLIRSTEKQLVLLTPYFNLPQKVAKGIKSLLKRDVKVIIVVGDKSANDFFIPADQPFKRIGGLPYIYEQNLRKFMREHQASIDKGLLSIRLWKDGNHTYHLKGIYSDDCYRMITGHNLNPRAWRLDFENALLIHDHGNLLRQKVERELKQIYKNTDEVLSYQNIQKLKDYPAKVQGLLAKLKKVKADFLIKRIT
ncbi:MAG: CDP-diacylglycerol--serine O-phosphatidyltransferase [Deltaproteobacteria bacterium]|jgi:CDP-diacylglycerol---serine O-phosphatidyltransferase|nr:CDP-diacylglycerol--serine O-phosphatidyltransferase [Deltaproteobacteria bacterium]